ncbi:MAG: protein adenylyltransferase SelO family protein, partial [Cyanobacteria bacterium J06639_14]
MNATNPFWELPYEPALESLGDDFYDRVQPATFPQTLLRFRNNALLPQLGLAPDTVTDQHFTAALGQFQGQTLPKQRSGLALRYHGYQFGQYNPY